MEKRKTGMATSPPMIEEHEDWFVRSSKKQTFHRTDCDRAEYIIDAGNDIWFESHDDAGRAGYGPCKVCIGW